jgi:hypothetical protein
MSHDSVKRHSLAANSGRDKQTQKESCHECKESTRSCRPVTLDIVKRSLQRPGNKQEFCRSRRSGRSERWRTTRKGKLVMMLSLIAAAVLAGPIAARASIPGTPLVSEDQLTSVTPASNGGYWVQVQDEQLCPPNCATTPPGYTIPLHGAPAYQDVIHAGLIAWVFGTTGYWIVTQTGHIYSRGGAPRLCNNELSSCSGFNSGPFTNLTAIAATPSGQGFWAVGRDGGVWTAGDAVSYGDVTNDGPVPTRIVGTPSGATTSCWPMGACSLSATPFSMVRSAAIRPAAMT